jgi:hypothetical protein
MFTSGPGARVRFPVVRRRIIEGLGVVSLLLVAALGASVASADGSAERPQPAAAHHAVVAADTGCPDATSSYDGPCGPLFTTPQWSDGVGWGSPSQYETIQLAKLDGPGEDLIARDAAGLWVEKFDKAKGQWELVGNAEGGLALSLPNHDGWNRPSQYRTIQVADLNGDGKPLLLARAADGLHVYRWDQSTDTFVDISKPPRLFSDAEDGNNPSVYDTIQTADLFGDGKTEVLGRTPKGIEYARWNQQTGQFEAVKQTGIAPDQHGGNQAWLYATIQTGNVSGDGKADLILHTAAGVRWYTMQPDGLFREQAILSALGDQNGYGRPSQYETIQTARLAPGTAVAILGRAADGLHAYRFHDGKWVDAAPTLTELSDGAGFDKPSQYRTIRTGDLTGHHALDVVARTRAGITAWELNYAQLKWVKLSTGPNLTGPVWDDPSHYETIRLGDITGDGRAALVVRGVFGIRTFAWQDGAFRRPRPYGDFPAFTGNDTAAYAEVSKLLLGHAGDFRKETYASPQQAITEATLNDYRNRLAERCTPAFATIVLGAPPRYTDCKPPAGSNVDPAAWTAVSNQIIAELWAASGVVAHFTILDNIETKLFQDQQGIFPALDAELTLPANPPDRSPVYIKLAKSALEILGDVIQFFPAAKDIPRVVRAIALTAHALGAVADGLGLSSAPSPATSYAKITAEIAKIQQRERDLIQAQRRYVLADYGLLSVIGSEVKGRLLTLDETAALSAGRQAFAVWATQLYLPAYWNRYRVTRCSNGSAGKIIYSCDVPKGPYVQVTGRDGKYTDFNAILVGSTYCKTVYITKECKFSSPEGATFSRITSGISSQCRYNPTPGSTDAWRYGCGLGFPAGDLIDGRAGWNFTLVHCEADKVKCSVVGQPAAGVSTSG